MVADYGPVIIEAVLVATYCFIGLVGCNMIPYIILVLAREFCTINVIELE